MTHKHETPEVLKTKLKEEVALISKLKGEAEAAQQNLQFAEQRLQDVIGAYILGAGLPQQGIRFDENFDLLFDTGESEGESEALNQEDSETEMEVVASKFPPKKTKVR